MESYFSMVTLLASTAVVLVHTILSLNVIPLYITNKFPLASNIILSIIATVIVSWKTAINFVNIWQWLAYGVLIVLVSSLTYRMTVKNSETVQKATDKKA